MSETEHVAGPPLAPAERRFNALLVDRLLAWLVFAAAGFAGWRLWWREGDVWPGVGLVVAVVLAVSLLCAVVLGATGTSPGRSLAHIRVVDAATGAPLGFPRALARTTVLGIAGLPTGCLGLAVLAWTAMEDPEGRRRGWHDRLVGSVVIDRRATPARVAEQVRDEPAPQQLVNLTALRLAPVTPAPESAEAPAVPARPAPESPEPARPGTARPGAAGTTGGSVVPGTVITGPRNEAPARWRLTADTGETVVLEGLTLLGRHPEARTGETAHHLLPLHSDDMSLSKTHLQVHIARDGTPVVIDRGSTNGSFLLRQGVSRDLNSGRPVTLLDGDRIRLGDRELRVIREE